MHDISERRNIVLGISGSIAAYKGAELARFYVSRGYEVRVVMTESACKFVSPLTFESLTGHRVLTSLWGDGCDPMDHIAWGKWADVIVIAPATANTIAEIAGGIANSALTALVLASKAKLIVVPAMNVNMWHNPRTQANVKKLKEDGATFVGPTHGDLACGWTGDGRLAPTSEIFYATRRSLTFHDYSGKRVLVTAGPTREPLDPVRFLSNRSSGKMGIALAREAYRRGAEVVLVHGPVQRQIGAQIECYPVESAQEMADQVTSLLFEKDRSFDIVIMVAAVADVRPSSVSTAKIKKGALPENLKLEENVDILATVGARKAAEKLPIKLVGFSVETGELEDLFNETARKLESKNADLMVGNFAEEAFDLDTNRVWMLDRQGRREEVATSYKSRVAQRILNKILKL
jgi:phosphopantothenoylcysteine decarboxylase/phosphopantothenate--cysteine ligase